MHNVRAFATWRQANDGNFRIEVDGGIDRRSAVTAREAGADTLVAGSAFFRDSDPAAFIRWIEALQPS
jgi:ribulose-phosphate 3-epimerase